MLIKWQALYCIMDVDWQSTFKSLQSRKTWTCFSTKFKIKIFNDFFLFIDLKSKTQNSTLSRQKISIYLNKILHPDVSYVQNGIQAQSCPNISNTVSKVRNKAACPSSHNSNNSVPTGQLHLLSLPRMGHTMNSFFFQYFTIGSMYTKLIK